MYYVYILRSTKNGHFYTGFTSNLRNRLKEHNDGFGGYTNHRGPYTHIYYEACVHKIDAMKREIYLKTGMGKRYIKNRLKRFLSLTG